RVVGTEVSRGVGTVGIDSSGVGRRAAGPRDLRRTAARTVHEIRLVRTAPAAPAREEVVIRREACIEGQPDHVLADPGRAVEEVILRRAGKDVFAAGLGIDE